MVPGARRATLANVPQQPTAAPQTPTLAPPLASIGAMLHTALRSALTASAQPATPTEETDTVSDTSKPAMSAQDILQLTLTGLVIALTTVHNAGVKLGHFGSTDFIAIADSLATNALQTLIPAPAAPAPAAA